MRASAPAVLSPAAAGNPVLPPATAPGGSPAPAAAAVGSGPAPDADPETSLLQALVGDGEPPLLLTGLALALSGGFALFLSAARQFLPHDVAFLGMTAAELARVADGRVERFMLHDRVAFGGALVALGVLYLWLTRFPLRRGEAWAWWALLGSGVLGFASFFAYLGFGYRDQWHGVATLFLFPAYLVGMVRARGRLAAPAGGWGGLRRPGAAAPWRSRFGLGRLCLLACATALLGAGAVILYVGSTSVFVPEDLQYMCVTPAALRTLNAHLIPLVAHDRAGFGGSLCSLGAALLPTVWCARPTRNWWEALGLVGAAGFSTAIGIHPLIGYNNWAHLLPAVAGALLYSLGLALCARRPPVGAGPTPRPDGRRNG